AQLSRIARPHVALVTTVEAAHLGHFASVEAIADAKAEIFEGIEFGGAAVLNRDNPYFARLAEAAQRHGIAHRIAFGEHPEAAVRLPDCRLGAPASVASASVMGAALPYAVPLPGRRGVVNSLPGR